MRADTSVICGDCGEPDQTCECEVTCTGCRRTFEIRELRGRTCKVCGADIETGEHEEAEAGQ